MGILLLLSSVAVGQTVITNVADVQVLSADEAAKEIPVHVKGQVVSVSPGGTHFFVLTDSGGAYVRRPGEPGSVLELQAGDLIEIEGKSYPGEFYPAIEAIGVKVVGSAEIPVGRPFRLDEIHNPGSDSDWVTVEGRLVGHSDHAIEYGRYFLVLEINDSIQLGVHLPAKPPLWAELPKLMFRKVRLNAIVGTVYNAQRQMTGRVFILNSIGNIELLEDEGLRSSAVSVPVEELMQVTVDPQQAVRTSGIVTHAAGNEIYLRGEESGLRVAVMNSDGLEVGQTVEVEGYVWPQPISPAFRALKVRVMHEAEGLPEPRMVELDDLFGTDLPEDLMDSRLNYELVRIRAHLVDVGKSFSQEGDGQVSLLCRSGDRSFEARLPVGVTISDDLKPGAFLKLTGICNLMQDEEMRWRLYPNGLWLQLRGSGDILIIRPAPWWTAERLLWAVAIIFAILLLFVAWTVLLRKTVDRQTGIISDKVEREAVLDERQRIARELHDNLEQGLAGTAIQLQGSRRLLNFNTKAFASELRDMSGEFQALEGFANRFDAEMQRNVDEFMTAQEMLAYCGEESRTSIIDLRGGLLEKMDLPAALKKAIKPLAQECGAEFDFNVSGLPKRLKQMADRNLLMVAREAVTNAVRHANPTAISVTLTYEDNALSLVISNNGKGFDPDALPPAGHFGLRGMHERINRIKGEIKIESDLEKGTTVSIELGSLNEWEPEQA